MAITVPETVFVEPAVVRVGLVADPLAARRLQTMLGDGFDVVTRSERPEVLYGPATAPVDIVVLAASAELFAHGGPVAQLRRLRPELPIVVVADRDERSLIGKALRAGVDGFVFNASGERALRATVDAALAGQLSVPRTIRNRESWHTFSVRERQVLQLVAEGLTNCEIAERLFLSESTVKSHLSASFRKLGVSSRAEAAALVLDPAQGLEAHLGAGPPIALERQLLGNHA